MKRIKQDKTVKFFVWVVGITVIAFVLRELSHIFLPFVIAYFLFFVFSPFNLFLEKKKFPQFSIILINVTILILFIWGFSSFVIGSIVQFSGQLPQYSDKLNRIINNAAMSLGISEPFMKNFSLEKLLSKIDLQILAGGVFSSTFSLLGSSLFVFFFFIFIITGHKSLYEAVKRRYVYKKIKPELKKIKRQNNHSDRNVNPDFEQWIGDKLNIERHEKEEKLANTFKAITDQIQRYIVAKIAINLAAAIIVTALLALFGVDFPVVWGLITFSFNFIPTIGSAIALILPSLLTLIQFESFGYMLLIALSMAAVQSIFFNIIEPNIIGKRLNLNPLLILLSLLIWGYIWGIMGMLLSIPLTAIIKIIISNSESNDMKFIGELMSKE